MLYRGKKEIWPPLPLYVGIYSFSNTKKAQDEVNTLLSYHFGEERFRRHDLKGVVKDHFNKVGFPWEYTTYVWEEEEVHQMQELTMRSPSRDEASPLGRIVDEEKE
jgi:hypothetical protein